MYPRNFFDTYWRSEILDQVFVAMPFNIEFNELWEKAIKPGIEDASLTAKRVDSNVLSGEIVTDILDGIAHSKIIVADISITQMGKFAGQRNANVMYEVGLAHAIRQPTEILLIRSDGEDINFDLAGINIHKYDKENISNTRSLITAWVKSLIHLIEQEKSLKVQLAIEQIDDDSYRYLKEFASADTALIGPDPKTMGETLVAIPNKIALANLQRLGILSFQRNSLEGVFKLTPFGSAVKKKLGL